MQSFDLIIVRDISSYDLIYLVPRLSQFERLSSLLIIRKSTVSFDQTFKELFNMIICNKIPMLKYLKLIVPCRLSCIQRIYRERTMFISNMLKNLVLNVSKIEELFTLFPFLPSLISISIHSLRDGASHN